MFIDMKARLRSLTRTIEAIVNEERLHKRPIMILAPTPQWYNHLPLYYDSVLLSMRSASYIDRKRDMAFETLLIVQNCCNKGIEIARQMQSEIGSPGRVIRILDDCDFICYFDKLELDSWQ